MIETIGGRTLTDEYWDCECKKNYIHSKSQTSCPVCQAEADDQPDSHLNEVIAFGFHVKMERKNNP